MQFIMPLFIATSDESKYPALRFCSGRADTHLFNSKAKQTIFEPVRKTPNLTNIRDISKL